MPDTTADEDDPKSASRDSAPGRSDPLPAVSPAEPVPVNTAVHVAEEMIAGSSTSVTEACLAPFVFASHAYDSFHLLMPLYLCRRWNGVVAAREHAALAWVRPNQLSDYPMPPADEPLVAWLRDLL